MANQKTEINSENIVRLLTTIEANIIEERTLALDRFKRQDDAIDSNDQFMFQGKILVEYLRAASDRTDALFNVVKLASTIVYKNDQTTGPSSAFSDDDIKKEIQRQLLENTDDTVETK